MSFIFKQIRKKVKYTKLVGQRSLEKHEPKIFGILLYKITLI